VGLRAGLDGRKISFPPGFDPGPSRQIYIYAIGILHDLWVLSQKHLVKQKG